MTIAEEKPQEASVPATKPAPAAALPARSWRLPAIDGMRAMACMMVFAIHTWEFAEKPSLPIPFFGFDFHTFRFFATSVDLSNIVKSFPAGVDLFMVLSGFCLFWPLCKSEDALQNWSCKEYFWRRIKRICPPYYVAIAYVILMPQLLVILSRMAHISYDGHEARWQPNPTWDNILAHMLFVHTSTFEYWDGITGAFWSLGLEAQFYLVFPLVVIHYRKHRYKAIIAMIALSLVFRITLHMLYTHYYHINEQDINQYGKVVMESTADHPAVMTPDGKLHEVTRPAVDELQNLKRLTNISFLGRWMQFAGGMLAALAVAHYYRQHKTVAGWIGTAYIAGALIIYTIILNWNMDGWLRDSLMGVLFSFALFAVCSTRTWVRHLFELKPIVFVGTISYTIFLIHQPTAWFFSQLMIRKIYKQEIPVGSGSAAHWMLLCTVGLVVVLLVAYPYYLLFEKPFISNKKPEKKITPALQPAGDA